jgi:hypothetical protein
MENKDDGLGEIIGLPGADWIVSDLSGIWSVCFKDEQSSASLKEATSITTTKELQHESRLRSLSKMSRLRNPQRKYPQRHQSPACF